MACRIERESLNEFGVLNLSLLWTPTSCCASLSCQDDPQQIFARVFSQRNTIWQAKDAPWAENCNQLIPKYESVIVHDLHASWDHYLPETCSWAAKPSILLEDGREQPSETLPYGDDFACQSSYLLLHLGLCR